MPLKGKRPEYGQRVPKDIRERFEAYVDRQITPGESDSPRDQKRKNRIAEKLNYYNTVIHPQKRMSGEGTESRKARYLTMQSLPDYLEAVEIPCKTFFEFCMGENSEFSGPDEKGWKNLCWPNGRMNEMAGMLKSCPKSLRERVSALIDSLQPAFYRDFRISLLADSGENMPNGRAASSRTEEDRDIPELPKELNMGDRMAETVGYLCEESHDTVKIICRERNLPLYLKKTYACRHYWSVFDFEDIFRFCSIFSISPHWAMFGPVPVRVLADSPESELIMDEFSFLPVSRQELVLETVGRWLKGA